MSTAKPVYLQKVKEQNLSSIIRHIGEAEAVSRVELVELTGLTSGTITNLTQELLAYGVIYESETSSSSVGRRRVMLRLNPNRHRMIGLDIGRSSYEVIMTDLTGRILQSTEGSTVAISEPERVIELVAPSVERMLEDSRSQDAIVLGLGLSIPGPMDIGKGVLINPPNFPGWAGFPVRSALESRFGLPVGMEDDAHTSALAERWFGLGKLDRNFVFVTMGMGIGGGVISDGELIRGTNGLYGQIGHMTLIPHGERCSCGNIGCWETVGSIPAILRHWGGGDRIEAFFAAVRRGDPRAAACLKETLYAFESALANLFHLYDPEIIVLGGRLYPFLAEYMPQVSSNVKSRVYAFARDRVRIKGSTFGSSQNAVGAATLVFGELLANPVALLDRP